MERKEYDSDKSYSPTSDGGNVIARDEDYEEDIKIYKEDDENEDGEGEETEDEEDEEEEDEEEEQNNIKTKKNKTKNQNEYSSQKTPQRFITRE